MRVDELANEIERLDRQATAAPWESIRDISWIEANGQIVVQAWGKNEEDFPNAMDNTTLIVALRNAAPLIVAALRLAEMADEYGWGESDHDSIPDTPKLSAFRAARAASESR